MTAEAFAEMPIQVPGHPLFDRERDLDVIDAVLSEAAHGVGRVLLIEGPAGIGKTALLEQLRLRAADSAMTVCAARAGELERGFGFGVVRQLLEAAVTKDSAEHDRLLAGAARLAEPVFTELAAAQGSTEIAFATLHGLYWLVVNLTERGPLVLSVDDVHWADEPSLRFLLHLAHRLAGLPVVVAIATRTAADRHRADLAQLMLEARPPVLRLQPLGADSVTQLVRDSLGDSVSDELCVACAEATGGNPFLLSELLGEFHRDARSVAEIDPAEIGRLGPERIAAAMLLRVSRLHPHAPALARAVAVLGEHARLGVCAELAGIAVGDAQWLIARLADLAVLVPGETVGFVHPVVRTAIYEDLSVTERAELHGRAARLLAARHADPAAVAVHLLATAPGADGATVSMLREAARLAVSGGAPDTAVVLLRRALDEPPDPSELPRVLFELGNAEHEIGDGAAAGHLKAAGELAADPVTRARAFVALAWSTHPNALRQREQIGFYEQAAEAVRDSDRELALQLQAARLGALLLNPDLPVTFEAEADRFLDLPALTGAECLLRSFVARRALETGALAVAGDLAEEAAAHPALVSQGGHPLWRTNITICLVEAERFEVADHILSRAIRHAERNGSPQWLARALWLRGLARHRRGDLRAAETDARASVELQGPLADYTKTPGMVVVIESMADQGRADEGEALLAERQMDGELGPTLFSVLPLLSRGRLRAAAGDFVRARADLDDALQRMALSRGMFPWAADARVALVPVLRALGEDRRARSVAEDAVAAAYRAASPRRIGGALRVLALTQDGQRRLETLHRAVDALAASPARLWRAQACVDFGVELARAGQRSAARHALREGMDLARRCGATPLAQQATSELRAAGGRPGRITGAGADVLTASERRVAELAAAGVSNKEIAQSLFVTLRTVEMHLSNAYTKLEIRSRIELSRALQA